MILLLVLACGQHEDTGTVEPDPLSWSVLASGERQVGYREVEQTYTDTAGDTVTTTISMWYPTTETEGDPALYFGVVEDVDAILDASVAPPLYDGTHPVMVFSHGSFLYAGSSSYLARHFASHGWLVVAAEHVGNTLIDLGDVPLPIYYQRPLNDMAALAAIDTQPDLAEHAARDQVVLAGYSFGGYDVMMLNGGSLSRSAFEARCTSGEIPECTDEGLDALEGSHADERIASHIVLAGATRMELFAAGGLENLSKPVLLMSGTEDSDDPQLFWDLTDGTELHWASIEAGCHEMFSVGGCPSIEREDGYAMIQSYALAHARHYLLGDTDETVLGLLDGSSTPWSQITLQSR